MDVASLLAQRSVPVYLYACLLIFNQMEESNILCVDNRIHSTTCVCVCSNSRVRPQYLLWLTEFVVMILGANMDRSNNT